jgi:hypothetical protein
MEYAYSDWRGFKPSADYYEREKARKLEEAKELEQRKKDYLKKLQELKEKKSEIKCSNPNCHRKANIILSTSTRKRKRVYYCSDKCRVKMEKIKARDAKRAQRIYDIRCQAFNCTNERKIGSFCSITCRTKHSNYKAKLRQAKMRLRIKTEQANLV